MKKVFFTLLFAAGIMSAYAMKITVSVSGKGGVKGNGSDYNLCPESADAVCGTITMEVDLWTAAGGPPNLTLTNNRVQVTVLPDVENRIAGIQRFGATVKEITGQIKPVMAGSQILLE